ncbi:MAG: FecR family protein, partial [Deltaproteobacteria bacterium]|nr:FecR family protein [Deltaproteobacteria bacterium]
MGDDTKRLERMGGSVAADLGGVLPAERRGAQKNAFICLVRSGRVRRQQRIMAVGAAVGVLFVAAAIVVVVRGSAPEPLAFSVGVAPARAGEGRWIRSGAGEPVPVRFADGSEIALWAGTTTRVVESDRDYVRIDLAGGRVRASIRGNGHRRWSVEAGPYRVVVLGTEFQVAWDEGREALDVDVTRGVVLVSGIGIDEHGIRIGAGRRLRADGRLGRVTVEQRQVTSPPPGARREGPTPGLRSVSEAVVPDDGVRSRARARIGVEHGARPSAWKTLCDRGDFAGAMAA